MSNEDGNSLHDYSDAIKLMELLNSYPIGFMLLKDDTTLVFANDISFKLLGLTRPDFIGEKLDVIIPEEFGPKINKMIEDVLKTNEPRMISIENMGMVLDVRSNKISTGIQIFLEDISYKTLMEQRLGRKLEYEMILTSISSILMKNNNIDEAVTEAIFALGTFLHAIRTRLFMQSDSGESLQCKYEWHSLEKESKMDDHEPIIYNDVLPFLSYLQENDFESILDYDEIPSIARILENELKRGEGNSALILPIYIGSFVEGFITVEFADAGILFDSEEIQQHRVITGVISSALSRMMIAEKLRLSEEQFRLLFSESLQGVMIVKGPPYKITFSNPAVSTILGYSELEISEMPLPSFEALIHWTDRPALVELLTKMMTGVIEQEKTTFRFIRKDSTVIWLDLSMARAKHENEDAILTTAIDVTDSKQAMADLLNSKRDLELYTSLLRHDLKNDLQAIFSNNEAIQLLITTDELIQELTDSTTAAVERMLDVLNIFGRPDVEPVRLIAPFLEGLTVEATRLYRQMILTLHIDSEIVMTSIQGGRLLPMVFHNILRNAAKYAGESPRINITASKEGEFISVRIADDGPGIASEIMENLFEKGVTTGGSGLGLYLSRKVMLAYGGSVELDEPRDGEGAVFIVRLVVSSG